MENNKPSPLILVDETYIPRENINSFSIQEYKIFPYFIFSNPFTAKKTFPFFRRWRPFYRGWKTRCCLEIILNNGRKVRKWYYDRTPKGYSSNTYASSGLGEFIRTYYKDSEFRER